MKTIILTDCGRELLSKLIFEASSFKKTETRYSSEFGEAEEEEIGCFIDKFITSGNEVLIVKFSGKAEVIESIGGDRSEMIVCLSNNKNSPQYVENLEQDLLKFIKET